MASITREVRVNTSPDKVWQLVRDVGQAQKLFPGVVSDCKMEGDARVVTFTNGHVVRELIVDINDDRRRVVYAAVGGRMKHHNASLRVFADGAGSRIVWTLDFLPEEMEPVIAGLATAGSAAMKSALSSIAP